MTVIYIAGPMYGLPEKNYPAFIKAQEQLEAIGHTVISPLQADNFVSKNDPEPSREWWQRTTMRLLLTAEAVALLDGWGMSKGANLEAVVADGIGMEVRTLAVWLEEGENHGRDSSADE